MASLAWLRDRIAQSIDSELAELCATRRSGAHRAFGWEGESALILDESLVVLDGDTRQIGAGIIVVTVAAALVAERQPGAISPLSISAMAWSAARSTSARPEPPRVRSRE
ncbi:hypothetical protein ACLQ2D_33940 [Streptomyces sp. DT199]|uniref:hypothetical protein n=1 Tax=Streptomyces sp. DT199 TaxID=3393421 RepID=UPI003CF73492